MFKKTSYYVLLCIIVFSSKAFSVSIEPKQFWGAGDSVYPILDNNDQLKNFKQYDFSELFLHNQDKMLGYIGDNYQRLFIHFDKVYKSKNPEVYLVLGKTKVQNAVKNFTGEIQLKHIYGMSKKLEKIKLDEYLLRKEKGETDLIGRYKENRLILVAKYTFHENLENMVGGEYNGTEQSYFYFENNKILYDDLDLGWQDSYANNLFTGIWKNHVNNTIAKCNFGNFRIPLSGDLDIGAGSFSPNSKYLNNGWQLYNAAYIKNDKNSLVEERKKWW